MKRFAGKTAVVTGATGHLGRATSLRLAQEGARLVLMGRDVGALEALSDELPGDHRVCALDLLDREAVLAAVQQAETEFGSIDCLIAAAGGFDMGPKVHEVGADGWQNMQALNLETLLSVLAAVVPGMKQREFGQIVTVGAYAALKGGAGMGPYVAAKSAVMRATESASAELKPHNINVNGVLPSVLDTPDNRNAMPGADTGKWVTLDKLAAVIAFLVSDDSAAVHGALIPVTGKS